MTLTLKHLGLSILLLTFCRVSLLAEDTMFQQASHTVVAEDYSARLESIEEEIAQLRSQVSLNSASTGTSCQPISATNIWPDSNCGHNGTFASAELLVLSYTRSEGIVAGVDDDEFGDSEFNAGFRTTVGYQVADCVGIHLRYFDFNFTDNNVGTGNNSLGVDTSVIDLELFETFHLNQCWTAELSGGLRYHDFVEQMVDVSGTPEVRRIVVNGLGGVAGIELKRSIPSGALYIRGRGAMIYGDRNVRNDEFPDFFDQRGINTLMLELALGYEKQFQLGRGWSGAARIGYEAHHWGSYSLGFIDPVDAEYFSNSTDVGLHGLAMSLEFYR